MPTPEADVGVPPPPSQQETAQQGQESGGAGSTHSEPAPPRRRTWLWVLMGAGGCLVVILVAVLGFAGCMAALVGSAASNGGSGGVGAPEKPPTIACEVGEPCDLGDSVLTITRSDETDLVSTSMDNFEGNFVLIEFKYTFGGTQPATVQDYRWKLEDGKGRTYNYAFDPTSTYEIAKNRTLLYEKVNPGIEKPGVIIFEVAPDSNDFILHVKDLVQPKTSKSAEIPLSTD